MEYGDFSFEVGMGSLWPHGDMVLHERPLTPEVSLRTGHYLLVAQEDAIIV